MFKAYGLYSHIRLNRLKSFFLLAIFVGMLVILACAFTLVFTAATHHGAFSDILQQSYEYMPIGAAIALIIAGLWFIMAYFFHEKIIDAAAHSNSLDRVTSGRIYAQLEALCISRGIPTPRLKIMETKALNAFASGLNKTHHSITVTRGLIEELTPEEMEAVLAHELTHIRNGDVQLMVIALIFVGIFSFIGEMIFSSNYGFYFGGNNHGESEDKDSDTGANILISMLITIFAILLTWGLSILTKFALSRSREYLADAGSAELTKNPDALISALQKISANCVIADAPASMAAFFIQEPTVSFADKWLATHPPIANRIDALVQFAGGNPETLLRSQGVSLRVNIENATSHNIRAKQTIFGKRRAISSRN